MFRSAVPYFYIVCFFFYVFYSGATAEGDGNEGENESCASLRNTGRSAAVINPVFYL